MAHVKITSHGSPQTTQIEVDGRRVPHVREFRVGQDMTGCPVLELTILVRELEIDAEGSSVVATPEAPRVVGVLHRPGADIDCTRDVTARELRENFAHEDRAE